MEAAEITLTLAALVVGPCLIWSGLMGVADVVSDYVVPRLLIAPASYPARAVTLLMLAGFVGAAAGLVACWL